MKQLHISCFFRAISAHNEWLSLTLIVHFYFYSGSFYPNFQISVWFYSLTNLSFNVRECLLELKLWDSEVPTLFLLIWMQKTLMQSCSIILDCNSFPQFFDTIDWRILFSSLFSASSSQIICLAVFCNPFFEKIDSQRLSIFTSYSEGYLFFIISSFQ